MRRTVLGIALACGASRAHAQDLTSFNQQVQLQINQSVILQTQDNIRWQMAQVQQMMADSPARWAQPHNDVIPAAEPPADMTGIPTFWPRPATFRGSVVVTISSYTPFSIIYYTTDGSIPTVRSAQYNGPITVSKTAKVLAIAVAPGHWQSPTAIGAYEIR